MGGSIDQAWRGRGLEREEAEKEGAQGGPCPFPRIKGSRVQRRACSELSTEPRRWVQGAAGHSPHCVDLCFYKKLPPELATACRSALSPKMEGRESRRGIHSRHGALPAKTQAWGSLSTGPAFPALPGLPVNRPYSSAPGQNPAPVAGCPHTGGLCTALIDSSWAYILPGDRGVGGSQPQTPTHCLFPGETWS